jgi:AcrR family transcriptional regulator
LHTEWADNAKELNTMARPDPRIYKTLRSIDQALLSLLREHPFQKITIEMICTTAMINRSTFYKYYPDKYALLEEYLEKTLSEFRSTVRTDFVLAAPSEVGGQSYTDLFRETLNHLYENRENYEILWNARICRDIYKEMIEIVRDSILEKMDGREENRRYQFLYATFFASNMMTLVRWWFQNEGQVSRDEVVRIMQGNMERGMFSTFKRLI